MTTRQLFKHLKNGKNVWLSYKQDDEIYYSINLSFKNLNFHIYSYYYTGNDEWDDSDNGEYHDVFESIFSSFNDMLKQLEKKFPGSMCEFINQSV